VIQEICVADAKATCHCACSFIRRAVNQTPDPGLYQRPCAHRARLNCRVNNYFWEPVVSQLTGSLAESNDFSVGCRIAIGASAVSRHGNQFVFADYASTDWDFTARLRFSSGGQSLPHPVLIKRYFCGSYHWQSFPSNNERPL
jgi:hypothetical protein